MEPSPDRPRIRKACADDASAIASLYRELVSDARINVLPAQVTALANSSDSYLLVAESPSQMGDEAGVCGTALLTLCQDVMYGTQPFGVVENVIVAEEMRGRGVGRALMDHIEALAVALHCTKLMLSSSAARHQAHAFFRRCGYQSDTKVAFVKFRKQFAAS